MHVAQQAFPLSLDPPFLSLTGQVPMLGLFAGEHSSVPLGSKREMLLVSCCALHPMAWLATRPHQLLDYFPEVLRSSF